MRHATKGFTLIEIMVAMTILFATVITAMITFQNNMQNSAKAAEVLHVLSQVDAARSSIKFSLQHEQQTRGQDLYTQDVKIDWQADEIAYLPPAPFFDENADGYTQLGPRYHLYAVTLTMQYGTTTRVFNYEELVWDTNLQRAASP